MLVILNPSPVIVNPSRVILNPSRVILNPSRVILNEVKNLCHWLRVNSVKNLTESISPKTEILRLTPQNDITTKSLVGGDRGEG